MNKKIFIAGSYNADICGVGKAIPKPGETFIGELFVSSGGKGSNQAIAAKKLGGDVTFITKLGNDGYADKAVELYKSLELYSESVYIDEASHTGVALILIDDDGKNSIMVCPGANLKLTAEEMTTPVLKEKNSAFIAGFQLECDVAEVCKAIEILNKAGVQTLLDPAPAAELPDSLYPCISIFKPNEHEAAFLSGIIINNADDAFRAGEFFLTKGVGTAIITMGEKGTVICGKDVKKYTETPKVKAVDTTGAGDIFSGAFMTALADGAGVVEAVEYAQIAASISVTRKGVCDAVPAQDEVLRFADSLSKSS